MFLFIDTNIFLQFYHLTSDDLEELKKLSVVIKKNKAKLLLPQQVIDEFFRNRENKIADAMKGLKDQKLNFRFPQLCKDYEEYSLLRDYQKLYEENHSKLVSKIYNDINKRSLKADSIIDDLFSSADVIPIDKFIGLAKIRCDIGNPPGKAGSLGDAINWECLIHIIPEKNDLYLISDDKDYCSPLDDFSLNLFLINEWHNKKSSKIYFYKRLSLFFKDKFPDIKLAAELEKDLLISDLAKSSNFTSTHSIIAKLREYSDFSSIQLNELVSAAINNNQVYWIINDYDVRDFFYKIIKQNADKIDESNLRTLIDIMNLPSEEDEIPF